MESIFSEKLLLLIFPAIGEGGEEFEAELHSIPDEVDEDDDEDKTRPWVPFRTNGGAVSSSSGSSFACRLIWASISFLLLKVFSQMVHL